MRRPEPVTRRAFLGAGAAAVMAATGLLQRPATPNRPKPKPKLTGFGTGPFGAGPFGG